MTLSAAQFLTPAELAEVRKRSDVRGILCVVHAWGVIFACMAAFALVPHPAVWAVGIVLVGARQLGLAILMHDAAHGVLTNDKRLNDRLAQWICAWPVLTDLYAYRKYHLQHHRFTQQANDPDLSLSAPFPITPKSLNRKIIRDLTGQTRSIHPSRSKTADRPAPTATSWPREGQRPCCLLMEGDALSARR